MEITTISAIIIGAAQAILWFFFVQTFMRISKLEDKSNTHDTSIEVLKSNQSQLENKVDNLMEMLKEVGRDIKDISIALAKKKDLDK